MLAIPATIRIAPGVYDGIPYNSGIFMKRYLTKEIGFAIMTQRLDD